MRKIIFLSMLVAGVAVFWGACVKTAPDYTNFSDISPIAELFTGGPAVNLAYIGTQTTPTDYTIEVNLASPNAANAPLPVTLAIDTTDFNEMNDSVGDIYTLWVLADDFC